ncbi:hypothetical protein, partial [Francisella sp. 19S2-10]
MVRNIIFIILILLMVSCGKDKEYEKVRLEHFCEGTVCTFKLADLDILVFSTVSGDKEQILSKKDISSPLIENQFKVNGSYADVSNTLLQKLGLPLCSYDNCKLKAPSAAVKFSKPNSFVSVSATGQFKNKKNKWQKFEVFSDWQLKDVATPQVDYAEQGDTDAYKFTITNYASYDKNDIYTMYDNNSQTTQAISDGGGKIVNPNDKGDVTETLPAGENLIEFTVTDYNVISAKSAAIPIVITSSVATPTVKDAQQGDTSTY